MIIDLILDRKGGVKYVANDFYLELMQYAETWPDMCDPIIKAMDGGNEQDVVAALCNYIKEAGLNGQLCDYISSVKWLEDDPEHSFRVQVTFPKDRLMDEQGRTEKQPFEFSFWQSYEEMAGGKTEEENFELTLVPFKKAVALADKMGWEAWLPITFEIPMVEGKWEMKPKSEKSALWIKEKLTEAKKSHKTFKGGEVVIEPIKN